MNHAVLHDIRAGFFLMVSLAMLAFICAVAALSTVMRPARWADRKHGLILCFFLTGPLFHGW